MRFIPNSLDKFGFAELHRISKCYIDKEKCQYTQEWYIWETCKIHMGTWEIEKSNLG